VGGVFGFVLVFGNFVVVLWIVGTQLTVGFCWI